MTASQDLAAVALRAGTLPDLPQGHFIDGGFRPAAAGGRMESFDPGRAAPFAAFARGDSDDVEAAVESARRAFETVWLDTPAADRGRILQRAAALIREEAARLTVVECLDSGKPLAEAKGDVRGAARAFEYYAGACDKLQGDTFPIGPGYLGYSHHEPVGVAAQIIPWNYPISTAARGIAPALAAGCAVVAKPAEQTPFTALLLAELLKRAGLPDGVLNVVTGTGAEAGAPLVSQSPASGARRGWRACSAIAAPRASPPAFNPSRSVPPRRGASLILFSVLPSLLFLDITIWIMLSLDWHLALAVLIFAPLAE